MEPIIGKWIENGHNVYEFHEDETFRNYSTSTDFKLEGQYYIKKRLFGKDLLTISVSTASNTLKFAVDGNSLSLYPNDGGNPIVFERMN